MTPNTLGVLVVFVATFLTCLLWATQRPRDENRETQTAISIEAPQTRGTSMAAAQASATAPVISPADYEKARETHHLEARRAFRKFWLAGTAGAFFSGLVHSLSADVQKATWSADWAHALVFLLRYGYVLWLLGYFFLSTFTTDRERPERSEWVDIRFDMLQSIFGLAAVFCLGSVNLSPVVGFLFANGAIIAITSGAWWMFEPRKPFGSRIATLRSLGLLFAFLGLIVCLRIDRSRDPGLGALTALAVLQLLLWAVLAYYWAMRWHEPDIGQPNGRPPFDEERFAGEWGQIRKWVFESCGREVAQSPQTPQIPAKPAAPVEPAPSVPQAPELGG